MQLERGDRVLAQKAAEARTVVEQHSLPFTRNPMADVNHKFKMMPQKSKKHSLNKARNSQYYTVSAESLLVFTND